jgi:type IV pilus assembly protein PilV
MRSMARARGFSLIEVLVALIIIGVGMLGIAKIQALAYAGTGTASLRSLAAIEAGSLASSMRANRGYWTVAPTPLTINVTTTMTASDGSLTTAANCLSPAPACTPAQVAGYDLTNWVTALNTLLPSVTGTVNCPTPIPVGGYTPPIGCTIQLTWYERNIGVNAQSQVNAQGTAIPPQFYTVYVEP